MHRFLRLVRRAFDKSVDGIQRIKKKNVAVADILNAEVPNLAFR